MKYYRQIQALLILAFITLICLWFSGCNNNREKINSITYQITIISGIQMSLASAVERQMFEEVVKTKTV